MKKIFTFLLLVFGLNVFSQSIYYVKPTGSDANYGNSWATAFRTLQKALATISTGEIWVAAGTYYPDEMDTIDSDSPSASFHLKMNVALYGGFAGTETERSQRNWRTNTTILSGDLDRTGNKPNAYHVTQTSALNNTAILDGFTISGGYAPYSGSDGYGAGMYNYASAPVISNCIFRDNVSHLGGAGIYNSGSSPVITNCSFVNNWGGSWGGGIMNIGTRNQQPSPRITNCVFNGNSSIRGGAVYDEYTSDIILNCTFTMNGATIGGGVTYSSDANVYIANSILWNNGTPVVYSEYGSVTIAWSIMQGGYTAGTGISAANPLFVNAPTDLHLRSCSPAIDAGINSGVASTPTDLDGQPRISNNQVDLGAYEVQQVDTGRILYVDRGATGLNNGNSWTDAFTSLQKALAQAVCGDQVWVAGGVYYPTDIGTERTASFNLKNGVAIYGGFAGTETELSQRRPAEHPTTLSGDIDGDGTLSANSNHVVKALNVYATTVLNGFTITGGNADDNGGGLLIQYSFPTIVTCIFTGNRANTGGAMYNDHSFPHIFNCIFKGNQAYGSSGNGGGVANSWSAPIILNSIFWANEAYNAGGVYNTNSFPTITNCVLWNNAPSQIDNASSPSVTFSMVQGGYRGTGNLNVNPQFVDPDKGDFHVPCGSPTIDAGDNPAVATPTDMDGRPRIVNNRVDIGVYEYPLAAGILYVKKGAAGRNDGGSWEDAFTSLQDALAQAAVCSRITQVWVAAAIYYPDEGSGMSDNDRSASFHMKNNLAIYGGFEGSESKITQRDPSANVTILSGDINGDGTSSGNTYHVVSATAVNSTAVLNGFTISGGNADNSGEPDSQGGGLYISSGNSSSASIPRMYYCTFSDNAATEGGAVYAKASYPSFFQCSFAGNKATRGGALYNTGLSQTTLLNVRFTGNTATNGGAIYNDHQTAVHITNALFFQNTAAGPVDSIYKGGAIFNAAAYNYMINCSFSGNTASTGYGGAIYNENSSPIITNTVLWGNSTEIDNDATSIPAVSYSLVQGGYAGGSNIIDADPLFKDMASGDLHLESGSPAIDAGTEEGIYFTDLDGNSRETGLHVDIGAYEQASAGGVVKPLTLSCPESFTLESDATGCGAVADFNDTHAAITSGGKGPAIISYSPASGEGLPVGVNTITVTATDGTGEIKTCSFMITVVDATAPVITGVTATPSVLYPPNHKMRGIDLAYTATANCGAVTTSISVANNESTYGSGDGNTGPDWIVVDDHHLKLRAERSGSGTDRIYTITITATDAAGNTATATTTVRVPHDNAVPVTTTQRSIEREEVINGLKVKAIPNPTTDGFTITTQSSSAEPLGIQVMDDLGRILEKRTGLAANGNVYLGSSYRPGMYFVEVLQGDTVRILRVIKQAR